MYLVGVLVPVFPFGLLLTGWLTKIQTRCFISLNINACMFVCWQNQSRPTRRGKGRVWTVKKLVCHLTLVESWFASFWRRTATQWSRRGSTLMETVSSIWMTLRFLHLLPMPTPLSGKTTNLKRRLNRVCFLEGDINDVLHSVGEGVHH